MFVTGGLQGTEGWQSLYISPTRKIGLWIRRATVGVLTSLHGWSAVLDPRVRSVSVVCGRLRRSSVAFTISGSTTCVKMVLGRT